MEDGDEDEPKPSTSSMLPTQPKNGHMKTYENPSRTFTRPYSAKTVYFYKEGDLYFTGVRLPISHHRYKTMHNLMDELNRAMYLPYGVRNITTPMGRTTIRNLDQLQHLGRYVASSSNPPKGVDLDKIQEKYSATLRRGDPTKNTTAGGQAYWILIVLNGKGKFHKAMINPMKMPKMEQLLDECSTALETAIHRLYTPQGKLITTVEEILAFDGPRIIACPRSERPHLNESANAVKLPEIHPSRYAPRLPVHKVIELQSGSNSASNSIEKPERLPVLTHRYVARKTRQTNGTNGVPTAYEPKSFGFSVPSGLKKSSAPLKRVTEKVETTRAKTTVVGGGGQKKLAPKINKSISIGGSEKEQKRQEGTAKSSATRSKDSGTGNSISSSRQSGSTAERPESMTERKAQMIRNELLANLKQAQSNSSDHYSEEDRILEEDSDYDIVGGTIQSGTEDEDEEPSRAAGDSSFRSTRRASEHRTPALRTPSTAGSASTAKSRATPYQPTPSRQTTANSNQKTISRGNSNSNSNSRASTSGSSSTGGRPKSTYSTRPPTGSESKLIEEREEEEEDVTMVVDSEESEKEEEEEEEERDTPAIHTPDTRVGTAVSRPHSISRLSSASSVHSFASESSKAWSRISGYSDKEQILPSSDEEEEEIDILEKNRRDAAANRIKRAIRKYTKKVKFERNCISYSIDVMIGTRFGIDFDTPLFVVLHGEDGKSSSRIWTTRPPWILTDPESYSGGGTWILTVTRTEQLGIITSIDVGHENEGYGAGTFIERVTVTEQVVSSGRTFHFPIDKWFDGGQVDGLIVRNCKLSSFYYSDSPDYKKRDVHGNPIMPKKSKNRWEFRLHTMESDLGGTTSHLKIIGFGEEDRYEHGVQNDSLMRDASSVAVIQVEFGEIGRLQKVRFELNAAGDRPHYFLEYVEAMDVDTRERCVVYVSDWLLADAIPGIRKWQPFREIAIFSKHFMPKLSRTFEGTVIFGDTSLFDVTKPMFIQYMSEQSRDSHGNLLDLSGEIPIVPIPMKDGNVNWCFKGDFISGETTHAIRVIVPHTDLGADIVAGMSLIGDVYGNMVDDDGAKNGTTTTRKREPKEPFALPLFIERIEQKAGDHVPYTISYAKSSSDFESNNKKGPFFKQMNAMGAKRATARRWKRNEKPPIESSTITWHLLMRLEDPRPHDCRNIFIPNVQLVAKDRRTFEMDCLNPERPDHHEVFLGINADGQPVIEDVLVLQYSCSVINFGMPSKIRLSCEDPVPDEYTRITKMKLVEKTTKTEVYFKLSDELNGFDTIELECFYPDLGANIIRLFDVRIITLEGGGDFRPFLNLIGANSDTGWRAYPGYTKWDHIGDSVDFELNYGVNLGELEKIEIWVKYGNPNNWKGVFEICEMPTGKLYTSAVVELSKNGQIALSDLEFLEIRPKRDEEEGETAI